MAGETRRRTSLLYWLLSRSAVARIVVMVLAALVVVGCGAGGGDPAPAPSATAEPGPTNTPIGAYRGYIRVSDAARRSPLSEDWAARFAEYTVDPERSIAIEQWREFRDLGVVFFGETVLVGPQIVDQQARQATVADCTDESAVTAAQNGRQLPNAPTSRRGRVSATVVLDGLTWRVSQLVLLDEPC